MPATVVFAPDSFKGTIAAADAARALADGWREARPDDTVLLRPMADGGEGTVAAFEAAVPGARRMPVRVTGPRGRPVDASWLLLPDGTGVVELASTSGIELLGGELRPWRADTRGFGEAIAAALEHPVDRLLLGLGSSASTDGGTGMLRALGARFAGARGDEIPPGAAGLPALAAVDLSGLRPPPRGGADALSDVTSPLLGPGGAAAVFGPQKGVDDVERAERGLGRLAALLSIDPDTPGAGAAGGTGYGLLVWGARIVPGAEEIAAMAGLPSAVADADLVVTGEGSFDGSSARGKAPAAVRALARAEGTPVALVAGRIAADTGGFAAAVSLTALAGSAERAMADPARFLRRAGAELARRL